MRRNGFFVIILLTLAWIVLTETMDWEQLAIGLLVSAFTLYFSDKFLPPCTKANRIRLTMLMGYPFNLLWRMLRSTFTLMKFIIVGARVDIRGVKTKLKSEPLQVVLASSFSLIPGSISLGVEGDEIVALVMHAKETKDEQITQEYLTDVLSKEPLERALLKVEAEKNARVDYNEESDKEI